MLHIKRSDRAGAQGMRARTVLILAGIVAAFVAAEGGAAELVKSKLQIRVGEKAPAFALTASDGRRVRLSDYAGHNVLLDFYRAHW